MEAKTYNGWTNYETWCVALWLDNDCGTYHHYQQLAQHCFDDADVECSHKRLGITRVEHAAYELSRRIKEEVEEGQPEVQGLYADLLGAALSEVDWFEIASHYIDDIREDDPASVNESEDGDEVKESEKLAQEFEDAHPEMSDLED